MLVGFVAAVVAVLLYALAAVLQTVGARRVTAGTTAPPGVRGLLREPVWLLGVGLLVLAFLAFVLSTRVLPLPLAEIARSVYPVVTVVLEHAVLGGRVRAGELGGAALVLVGPVLLAAQGGERGHLQASVGTAAVMLGVLAVTVAVSTAASRMLAGRPVVDGATQAVLSGICFSVVDLGVRSLPDPFAVVAAVTTPACWVGAVAAPFGLLLFSRAVARTTAGVATVLLTVVNVFVASSWSIAAFQDSSDAGVGLYALAAALAGAGLWLMARSGPRGLISPGPR